MKLDPRDLRLADLLLMHPPNDAAFIHTQLHKRAGHIHPPETWANLSLLHLKMESAPWDMLSQLIRDAAPPAS
ncbi:MULTISPECIES: hypothetical protein [unclassified Ensifer]|uniref:hypothetical protein n=1 Tax=unclassified Ensifer TaxID=2633371 RepID=UPI0011128853|nr:MULTISPECIES: hypothetical protein [unclassified Ensifer]